MTKAKRNSFQCVCCSKIQPIEFLEEHHEIPQSAGGTEKDEIDACAGCHAAIHAIASVLMSREKIGKIETVLSYFEDEQTRHNLVRYAKQVVEYTTLKKDGAIQGREFKQVTVNLKNNIHMGLATLARDTKVAITKYAEAILEQHVLSEFPNLGKK